MARRPSDDEFADFVTANWPALYRTAYLLLGDRGLAEDLVQTALARTYVAWPRIHSAETAPAYARRTLVNTATEWFRRKSWRNERPTGNLPEPVHHPQPEDRVAILDALRQLAPRQRAVIVLRYYEGLPVRETADALGCAPGTVKSQTSEALARLRTLLGDSVIPTTLGSRS